MRTVTRRWGGSKAGLRRGLRPSLHVSQGQGWGGFSSSLQRPSLGWAEVSANLSLSAESLSVSVTSLRVGQCEGAPTQGNVGHDQQQCSPPREQGKAWLHPRGCKDCPPKNGAGGRGGAVPLGAQWETGLRDRQDWGQGVLSPAPSVSGQEVGKRHSPH